MEESLRPAQGKESQARSERPLTACSSSAAQPSVSGEWELRGCQPPAQPQSRPAPCPAPCPAPQLQPPSPLYRPEVHQPVCWPVTSPDKRKEARDSGLTIIKNHEPKFGVMVK